MLEKSFQLIPFETSLHKALKVLVTLEVSSQQLNIQYIVQGDLEHINLAKFETFDRGSELWKTTCFECFLKLDENRYVELNFSSKGLWDIYTFADYRKEQAFDPLLKIQSITTQYQANQFALKTIVDLNGVRFKELAISTIIEDKHRHQSFWALKHAQKQADFHDFKTFIML